MGQQLHPEDDQLIASWLETLSLEIGWLGEVAVLPCHTPKRHGDIYRLHYDLAKAAERIRDTKYPQAQDFAARNVLEPQSDAEMLEAFTRVELR